MRNSFLCCCGSRRRSAEQAAICGRAGMARLASAFGTALRTPLLVLIMMMASQLATVEARDASDTCVSFKYHYSCAIRASDHTVECWHHYSGEIKESPVDQQFVSISCKGRELCGVLHDGGLAQTTDLWPEATGVDPESDTTWDAWRSVRVETSAAVSPLSCERDVTCYIAGSEYTSIHTRGGQLVCWPDTDFYAAQFPRSDYTSIALAQSSCLEEGSCSEQDFEVRYSPVCTLNSEGGIACCCGHPDFMASVPTTGKFVDISISDTHGCGVLEEGGIVCWGSSEAGKTLAPNIPNGSGGSTDEALTIDVDGLVQDKDLVYAAASQQTGGSGSDGSQVKFVAVSTSSEHTCGLLWNGASVCFSSITDTELDIASAGCALESVVSDGYVSCGRLMRENYPTVPEPLDRDLDVVNALARVTGNSTSPIVPSTGVFCWQSFPESFLDLERVTEQWNFDQRRVPLDIRPPLETLATCMALPQRESSFDRTRGEALAIALILSTALAFSAYRMVILKRFGDFSWGVTVADHMTFWFGFLSGLFDLVSQVLFVFMDITYISFRAMYLEANMPYPEIVLANIVVAIVSAVAFLYTSWVYSKDEFGKIDIRSPMAIAKRRFLTSGAMLLLLDVPQMVFLGIYGRTMIRAGLRPSVTAIFSCICCCVGPVFMVVQNYFRAKNATSEVNQAVVQKEKGMSFGNLADMGAGPFGSRRKPAAKRTFTAQKMFGKGTAAPGGLGSPARVSPAPSRRHKAGGADQSALIAAFAAKKTQARLRQLASATTTRKIMGAHPERRKMETAKLPSVRGGRHR